MNEACPWIQTDNQSGGIDLAEDISARVSNVSNLQWVPLFGCAVTLLFVMCRLINAIL